MDDAPYRMGNPDGATCESERSAPICGDEFWPTKW
jgi:hypothetical protein